MKNKIGWGQLEIKGLFCHPSQSMLQNEMADQPWWYLEPVFLVDSWNIIYESGLFCSLLNNFPSSKGPRVANKTYPKGFSSMCILSNSPSICFLTQQVTFANIRKQCGSAVSSWLGNPLLVNCYWYYLANGEPTPTKYLGGIKVASEFSVEFSICFHLFYFFKWRSQIFIVFHLENKGFRFNYRITIPSTSMKSDDSSKGYSIGV
jgi:hypothetical protein